MNVKRMTQPLMRLARRVGLCSTPLRRPVDRWENTARVAAVVVALALLPLSVPIGRMVYARGLAESASQTAQRHQVTATLLSDSPLTGDGIGMATQVLVQARWTSPGNRVHTRQIAAAPGLPAGSRVPVWVDAAGQDTSPPLSPDQAYLRGIFATLGAGLLSTAIVAMAYELVRRRLNRIRVDAWAQEWQRIGPDWTRHRR